MSKTKNVQAAPAIMAGAALPVPQATSASRPRASGLTPEVLIVSTILALPAFYTSVVLGTLPLHVVLERYLVVIIGVLMISEPLYWFGVGGRTAPPRDFAPEEGHRVPRRSVLEPTDVRHASMFDDDFSQPEVDEWGTPLFGDGDLNAPPPLFDDADLNAPGVLGEPFETTSPFDAPAPVIDDVLGPLDFDDPADLARPSFD